MPIYEYACERCGTFEEMQRITDDPLAKCPKCKGKVHRLISQTSFQLKGSGWYVTDYARKGNGASGKKEGGTEAPSEGGTAKSETKAEASKSSGASEKPAS
jgi:putative FmdB family regulatory protein